jgi:hypothetical protein
MTPIPRSAFVTSDANPRSPCDATRAGALSSPWSRRGGGVPRSVPGLYLARALVEGARQPVFRVCAELVGDARRRRRRGCEPGAPVRADDDLSPADPVGEVRILVGERDGPRRRRRTGVVDDLETGRVEAAHSLRKRDRSPDGGYATEIAVDAEPDAAAEPVGQLGRVRSLPEAFELVPRLIGGDLGEVEDVEDVDAVAREVEARVPVRREVAERMRRRQPRDDERREHREGERERSHPRALLATGA